MIAQRSPRFFAAAIAVAVGLFALNGFGSPRLPPGFTATTVVEGINAATALTIAPDGRVFYAEQTGAIRVVKDGRPVPTTALDLGPRLDTWWERGLIGLTLHPDFPRTPYLFVLYVAKKPYTHHVVARFTVVGDTIDPESELVLLEGDDQSTLGGHVPAGHQGGPICFGHDGMLYVGLGERTANESSQALDTLQGKILRLRPDGSIPEDNPFHRVAGGKYRSIYAIGIRNPFGLAVEPESGRLFETDVGGSAFEEINEIIAGGNYGWPHAEGMSDDPRFVNPLHAYPPAVGRSICGAMFYPIDGAFPDEWKGRFFFVDWASHWVRAIDPDAPETQIPFGEGFQAPVGIAAASDGSIYVLNRNTRWRDGKAFKEDAGSLIRIEFVGESVAPAEPRYAPLRLGETRVFDDVRDLIPAEGSHPFSMNAPVWLPGVKARRWIRVPAGTEIDIDPEGPWKFPEGTTVIEHFDTEFGAPHETHLYTANADGTYRAAAYRWETGSDGADAALVEFSEIVSLPGDEGIPWLSPGVENAVDPGLAVVGFVPQFNTRQLNVGKQLSEWRDRGWIDSSVTDHDIARFPRLGALADGAAPIQDRVRSYLDANCSGCHRPGGPSRGLFDARWTTPLREQGLLFGALMAGNLGIDNARVLVPGSPEKSMLYQRMKRHDAFRMPPVSVHDVPSPVLPLMEAWIREMNSSEEDFPVRLDEDAVDPSADHLPAYRIKTPIATYYLEKSGAGFRNPCRSRRSSPTTMRRSRRQSGRS